VRDTSHKDARSAGTETGAIKNRRTPQILALTILLSATICGSIARAQEMFKLLGEKEIRARVVGRDITDSTHWVSYLRPTAYSLATKWDGNGAGPGKSRTTNSVCRIQTWSRPTAMKSGCPAQT
jgi:hypothetical protein